MKTFISTMALVAAIGLAGGALAQTAPTGGPDAKGNAPLKNVHTVNDGTAKAGANSFTQNEARKHIMNSGYTDVSGLAKGKDGVWRGTATKGGAPLNVALDFKGNVSEGGPAGSTSTTTGKSTMATSTTSTMASSPAMTGTDGAATVPAGAVAHHSMMHHRHHHGRRHHVKASCANPGPNGAACSGPDRNKNGISDKEDRAIKAGAKP